MNQPCFYRVSVKGLVTDGDGRILLAREGDAWEMLGGGLDHGEDPIEGLRRELREECGLTATSISSTPKYFFTWQEDGVWRANAVYAMTLANLNFKPSEECQELRFFNLKEMAAIKLFPNIQKLHEMLTHA